MEIQNINDFKMNGVIYQIYSKTLDQYYIGSTFQDLKIRKSVHRSHSKSTDIKYAGLRSKTIAAQPDAEYSIIITFPFISKKNLLLEETYMIMFLRGLYGSDKVLNKSNTGLTLNIPQYMKNYKAANPDKMKKYKEKFNRDYHRSRYLERKASKRVALESIITS